MAKKIVRLTDEEFRSMINEAVSQVLKEVDVKTAMRVPNASAKAQNEIQKGFDVRQINTTKSTSNYDLIQKAQSMWSKVENHRLNDFQGFTFSFFSKDGIGLVAIILFTFERLTKLSSDKTILTGTITYNNQFISGDRIIINLDKGTVKYHERGSRYNYSLEIDRRTKPQWDALLKQLQKALNARK
ncbi:MAG: hypothetical protein HDS64_04585 [Bacteroidales bacterium]|nr:hypothetical protein [Bacteroidales bacterium]